MKTKVDLQPYPDASPSYAKSLQPENTKLDFLIHISCLARMYVKKG